MISVLLTSLASFCTIFAVASLAAALHTKRSAWECAILSALFFIAAGILAVAALL